MFRRVPESGEQLVLVRAWDELHWPFLGLVLEVLGLEEHLPALRVGVQHRDAYDLRGEGPEAEEAGDFLALGGLLLLGKFLRLAEKVFLLRLVEQLHGQARGFNVEDEGGHSVRGWFARAAKFSTGNLRRNFFPFAPG